MRKKRKTTKRMLMILLAFIVASAFSFATPDETYAATKRCKAPKITYAKSTACNKICLKYAPAGKGTKPSTYFVYVKAPGGKYKLAAKTSKKTFTVAKLKANTKYTFKVRAAKAYYQKQYYNTKTKKWQKKQPKKKHWKGKKTRKVLKYKWYSKYSTVKTVKTKAHGYNLKTVATTFSVTGYTSGSCKWCKHKKQTVYGKTAGKSTVITADVSLMRDEQGSTGAFLSWNDAAGATGYIIERSADGESFTDIFYSSALYYFDTAVQTGKTYSYRVTAYANSGGNSVYGKTSSAAEITISESDQEELSVNEKGNMSAAYPLLTAPTNLTAAPSYMSVKLTWKAVPKAKRYAVYCGEEKIGETAETTFTASDLTPKTEYTFKVMSLRDTLIGLASDKVTAKTTAVPAPKNIKADAGWDSVTLRWDAVNGAQGYYIRSDETTLKERVTTSSYEVTGLEPFTKYTFYVQAYIDGKYSSLESGKITAKTGFQAPGNLGVTNITDTTAILSWDPVDGADSYRIYKENGTSVVATTSDCSYKITGLSGNQTYSFYVAAGKDGTFGLLDDTNKVTFTTVLEQEGFIPNENITMTYGNATFYLGQNWSPSLESSLKAASNGFEKVSRPGYAHELLTYTTHAATEYFFDIEDYSDFLAVKVADGKIIGWETNGPLFGIYYGDEVAWGDSTMDYPYGSESGYRTRGSACTNIFTDIDRGDTVIGGFSFLIYPRDAGLDISSEKRIGYHYINAYREAAGRSIMEYSDALDGRKYTWSGTVRGREFNDTRYGMQALAETVALNKPPAGELHSTETMTKGPLAGQTMNERFEIIYGATGIDPTGENVANGNIGEACLASYMSSNGHLSDLVRDGYTIIGIGISGNYNTQTFAY